MKLKAIKALGFVSVGRALLYRISLLAGLNSAKRLAHEIPRGPYFSEPTSRTGSSEHLQANTRNTKWDDALIYFGWFGVDRSSGRGNILTPPYWFYDPFNDATFKHSNQPWWQIPDFAEPGTDVKSIWELSRFDWVLALSQRTVTDNPESLGQLNEWISDWSINNPPYLGPNWKCGQEASIRVMHLLVAALILQQENSASASFVSLVLAHLKRIRPTLMYALAQDNNHGTSEAAALWLGGSFLELNGHAVVGKKYKTVGARYLNERAHKLIMDDGSFSQYSITYHRLMLETMSLCEIWARKHNTSVFSENSVSRLSLATCWLASMVMGSDGDAPNLGANDGAHLLPLTNADYRDFRPAVNLASFLFCQHVPYGNETALAHLQWLGIGESEREREVACAAECAQTASSESQSINEFADGGFVSIKRDDVRIVFRYPRFKFRPGQCDVLHVDLWSRYGNILRDAGSYSYNASSDMLEYFSGPAGHNTIEFDRRAAMPKLSRFLYGEWLKPTSVRVADGTDIISCEAGYKDWQGASHQRALSLNGRTLKVVDTCAGYTKNAVLRWRLINADWQVNDSSIASDFAAITIRANHIPVRLELVTGYESRYYMQKTELPVIEVEFAAVSGEELTITTEIRIH